MQVFHLEEGDALRGCFWFSEPGLQPVTFSLGSGSWQLKVGPPPGWIG